MEPLAEYSIIGSVVIVLGLISLIVLLDEFSVVDIVVYLVATVIALIIGYRSLVYWFDENNCLDAKRWLTLYLG